MTRSWDELQRDFRRVVALRRSEQTIDEVAAAIPLGRKTVYRILGGEVEHPGLATRDCIERFVEKGERLAAKACQLTRTPEPPPPDATEG